MQMNVWRIVFLYFVALLSMGLFHLATTPVFEGFDEPWHYSAIRQVAYQGKITMREESYVDQFVLDYQGPLPYDSGRPPFDRSITPFERGTTYGVFVSDQKLNESYVARYRETAPPAVFALSSEPNNLYRQHPALYYVVMASVLRLVDGTSLVTQIFILRLLSYLLALSGVALGILATSKRKRLDPGEQGFPLLLGFLIYPYLSPMFFPQFARVGSDSLCLFLVGLLAYLFSKWLSSGGDLKSSVSIGVVLGIGLLTKAFFVPIAAAVFMYVLMPAFAALAFKRDLVKRIPAMAGIFLPAVIIGGGWYIYNHFTYGSFSGSNLGIWLAQRGGLLANLDGTFSLAVFVRGLATAVVTYLWGGTQSLAHLPYVTYAPLLAALGCIVVAFCFRLRKIPLADPLWLSMWLAAFFAFGIAGHAMSNMAMGGNGNTPGWYFHMLIPFFAPAIGIGVYSLFRTSKSRCVFLGFVSYAAIFHCIAIWFQLALFSGCAVKGDDKHYLFQSKYLCLDNASMVVEGVGLFGYPVLAGLGLFCWVVASIWLFVELQRIRQWGSD
jgi:hypothetical protein